MTISAALGVIALPSNTHTTATALGLKLLNHIF